MKATRRTFLTVAAALGGGLALGVRLPGARAQRPAKGKARPRRRETWDIGAWIIIANDGSVTVRVTRSELGQGIVTGLAQLVAEELECEWSAMRTEFVEPGANLRMKRIWGDFSTSNSRTIRSMQGPMREAGAAARLMLLEAAAVGWNVDKAELSTENGVVHHKPSARSSKFADLAAAAAKLAPPDRSVIKLKPSANWTIAGRPLPSIDQRAKVDGSMVYGTDVRLPGMLSAAIRAHPVPGGKLGAFDGSAAETMPGVKRVLSVGDDAVAVVAETWWQANVALEKVAITWAPAAEVGITSESISAFLKTGLEASDAFVGRTHGDALAAIRDTAQTVEAVYATPFLHHATLEPMNATALYRPERLEVWAPTQNAEQALRTAAEAAGIAPELVEVHRTAVGGAFGRRLKQDFVRQVALIARAMPGVPVKLIWSREEDTAHGHYRPVTEARLRAGIDDKGEPTGLILRISGQSILTSNLSPTASTQPGRDPRMFQGLNAEPGESQMGYSIPSLYIDHAMRNTHIPVGSWRGVHATQNGVYLECFIDEMAYAAKRDPLEFRKGLMKGHPRHLAVLSTAAEKAGWDTPPPLDVHRGIAQMMAVGSYAAAVAEVTLRDGELRVLKVVVALDCGTVVNPALVERQVEGQVAMAVSATLGEAITIREGHVVERNFDSYPVLRLRDMPHVEIYLVPSGEFWGGV
ncbi:MAG: xanthine dehydrogenase family protein molybdopterin-binding subunit, partial [Proteobacteria bacterium]|nr:xanthine dehydrogenase family protein molybdopterin-binding subunit [Pseudomonadota bacterium]